MMTVSATLEGQTGFWGGNWIASARKTYFGSFANTFARRIGIFNEIAFPNFADLHVKVTFQPWLNQQVRGTVLASRDRLDWIVDEDALGAQGYARSLYRGGRDIAHTAVGMQCIHVPNEDTRVRMYANWYENAGGSALGGGLQAWVAGLKQFDSPFGLPDPVFPSDVEAQFTQTERYALQCASAGARVALAHGIHSIETGAGVDRLRTDLSLEFDANEFGTTLFDAIRKADPLFSSLGENASVARVDLRAHFFAQDKIRLFGGGLFVQPAVRYDHYGILGRGYATPRLSVSVPAGQRTTVRLAGGRYVQSPGLEKALDPDDNANTARLKSLDGLTAESAWHAGGSVSTRVGTHWSFRFQGYQKWYQDLLVQDSRLLSRAVARYFPAGSSEVGRVGSLAPSAWVIDFAEEPVLLPDLVNVGSGRSYGAEGIVAREQLYPEDVFSGWLSYAYAHAMWKAGYHTLTVVHLFSYDRRHTLNMVFQWRIFPYLSAGLTWCYGTGFPYTPALRLQALVAEVEDPGALGSTQEIVLVDPTTGYARLVPGYGGVENRFSRRFPSYHRLDFRVTWEARWQGLAMRVYADAINVYNRKNTIIHKYFVGTDAGAYDHLPIALRPSPVAALFREPVYGFPFIPSLGLSCSF